VSAHGSAAEFQRRPGHVAGVRRSEDSSARCLFGNQARLSGASAYSALEHPSALPVHSADVVVHPRALAAVRRRLPPTPWAGRRGGEGLVKHEQPMPPSAAYGGCFGLRRGQEEDESPAGAGLRAVEGEGEGRGTGRSSHGTRVIAHEGESQGCGADNKHGADCQREHGADSKWRESQGPQTRSFERVAEGRVSEASAKGKRQKESRLKRTTVAASQTPAWMDSCKASTCRVE
jgi:hypothetical protein